MNPQVGIYTERQLAVDPNNGCNLNCLHCGLSRPHLVHYTRQAVMSPTRFGTMLQLLGQFMDQISLGCIREPLVHPRLADLILALDRLPNLKKVELSTNGVLLNPEVANLLAETAKDMQVTVSLESADPVLYAKIRRGATLEAFTRCVRHTVANKHTKPDLSVFFSTVIMKPNFDELDTIVQFTRDLGADGIIFLRLQRHDGNAELMPDNRQQAQIPEMIDYLIRTYDSSGFNVRSPEAWSTPDPRKPLHKRFAIMNHLGNLYTEGQRAPIGSIFNPGDRAKILTFYNLSPEQTHSVETNLK